MSSGVASTPFWGDRRLAGPSEPVESRRFSHCSLIDSAASYVLGDRSTLGHSCSKRFDGNVAARRRRPGFKAPRAAAHRR